MSSAVLECAHSWGSPSQTGGALLVGVAVSTPSYRINGPFVEIDLGVTYTLDALRALCESIRDDPAVADSALLLFDASRRTVVPTDGDVRARLHTVQHILRARMAPVCAVIVPPVMAVAASLAQQTASLTGLRMGLFPDAERARRWLQVYAPNASWLTAGRAGPTSLAYEAAGPILTLRAWGRPTNREREQLLAVVRADQRVPDNALVLLDVARVDGPVPDATAIRRFHLLMDNLGPKLGPVSAMVIGQAMRESGSAYQEAARRAALRVRLFTDEAAARHWLKTLP